MMITPEQVKAYRKALKLTQSAFAARCCVSEQLVRCHWEKFGIPEKDILKARAIQAIESFKVI